MSKVGIAIKTCDRSPKKNFLSETLCHLERAGVFESEHLGFLVIVDSRASETHTRDEHNVLGRLQVDRADRNLHQNAARCIELASVVSTPEVTWSMVLEDDLDVCDEFLEQVVAWLTAHDVGTPQMYALGANYAQIDGVAERGGDAWAYPVGAFYGAQALVWKRSVAAQLAAWLGPDPNYNGVRDHGHDLLLQRWGREQGLTHFIASAPCMVQHTGEESAIGNRFFQFPWGGRDWRYERRSAC